MDTPACAPRDDTGVDARVVEPDTASGAAGTGGRRWRALCQACRQVFGMPDYDRYLAHAAVTHPGAPVLTREEFVAQAIERRYGGGMGRCC